MNIEISALRCHGARIVGVSEAEIRAYPRFTSCPTCDYSEDPPTQLASLGCSDWKITLQIVICRLCETIYYLNPPSNNQVDTFYRSAWGNELKKQQQQQILSDPPVNRKIASLLVGLNITDRAIRILDVGCGLGGMIAGLMEAGFSNVYGLEPSEHRANNTRLRFADRIMNLGYADHVPESNYEIIYCNHVLEHIYQPKEFIQWAISNLSSTGFLVVCVPNAQWEQIPHQLFFLPHLHSFPVRALTSLANNNNVGVKFWKKSPRKDELCAIFSKNQEALNSLNEDQFCSASHYPNIALSRQTERLQSLWTDSTSGNKQTRTVNWSNANRLQDIVSPKQRWDSHTKWHPMFSLMFNFLYIRRKFSRKYFRYLGLGEGTINRYLSILSSREVTDYNYLTYTCEKRSSEHPPVISYRGKAPILIK